MLLIVNRYMQFNIFVVKIQVMKKRKQTEN